MAVEIYNEKLITFHQYTQILWNFADTQNIHALIKNDKNFPTKRTNVNDITSQICGY